MGLFDKVLGGAADVLSAREGKKGAQRAGAAFREGSAKSRGALTSARDLSRAAQQPFWDAGQGALQQLSDGAADGRFDPLDLDTSNIQLDPGYQFARNEGFRGLDSRFASKGLNLSGKALRDSIRFGNDFATAGFAKAYDRRVRENAIANANIARKFGQRLSTAGISERAAGNISNIESEYGRALSANYLGEGSANAREHREVSAFRGDAFRGAAGAAAGIGDLLMAGATGGGGGGGADPLAGSSTRQRQYAGYVDDALGRQAGGAPVSRRVSNQLDSYLDRGGGGGGGGYNPYADAPVGRDRVHSPFFGF